MPENSNISPQPSYRFVSQFTYRNKISKLQKLAEVVEEYKIYL